jgi:hypothetical protein
MPLTIVAMTGLAYWGRFNPYVKTPVDCSVTRLYADIPRFVNEEGMTLPVNEVSFQAENARSWLIRFWELPGYWVGIAFPFGLVLWILFYFDHNVSVSTFQPPSRLYIGTQLTNLQSLIAQGSEFPLKKPPGFHWDFFLLGFIVFGSGLLGLPASNGNSASFDAGCCPRLMHQVSFPKPLYTLPPWSSLDGRTKKTTLVRTKEATPNLTLEKKANTISKCETSKVQPELILEGRR